MDMTAMFKIGYGLYVLTTRENGFDNGCIINTVSQVTANPNRITIAVNKANKTHDMVLATGEFNVSILANSVPFDTFKAFGFRSGNDCDKFADKFLFLQSHDQAPNIYGQTQSPPRKIRLPILKNCFFERIRDQRRQAFSLPPSPLP